MRRLLTFLSSPWGQALRYVASAAILTAFVWQIEWRSLTAIVDRFDARLTGLALLLTGAAYPLMAWRWWLLGRPLGFCPDFRWAHRITWIGQFYASLLPGGIGGEAARTFYVLRDVPAQRAAGVASVVWDRFSGLIVLFALATAALLLRLQSALATPELRWLLGLAAAGTVIGVIFVWRVQPTRWPDPVRRGIGVDRCARIESFITPVRRAPGVMTAAFALTILIWMLDFAGIALLAQTVGLQVPFLDIALAGCVAYAASALPISIGGHGIREGALLFTLIALQALPADPAARDAGLLLGLLVWGVTIFWSLVGGLCLLGPSPKPLLARTAASAQG